MLATCMVDISNQAQTFRKSMMLKWFTNLLDDDEKPISKSAFRLANPTILNPETRQELNGKKVNKHIGKLSTFIKRRRMQRDKQITKVINA